MTKETIIQKNGGSSTIDTVVNLPLGKGRLLWSPLPVELSERRDTTVALYSYAVNAAFVERDFEWISGGDLAGIYGRKLSFATGALFTFVSEYAQDAKIEVKDSVLVELIRSCWNRNVLFFLPRIVKEICLVFIARRKSRFMSIIHIFYIKQLGR